MIIRFLGHDGYHHYFAGTTAAGHPTWTTDPAKAFLYESEPAAQRMAARLQMEGFDVEIGL